MSPGAEGEDLSEQGGIPSRSYSPPTLCGDFASRHDAPHQAEVIGDMYYRYDPNGNVTEERQGSHSDDAESRTFMYSTPVTGVTSANQAWGWSRIDDTGETDSTC